MTIPFILPFDQIVQEVKITYYFETGNWKFGMINKKMKSGYNGGIYISSPFGTGESSPGCKSGEMKDGPACPSPRGTNEIYKKKEYNN
jgi:hypothetical protein